MNNHICPSWLSFSLNNRLRRFVQNPEELLGEFIVEGQTVMDIGCGPGLFSLAMANLVGEKGRVISVDVQKKMLDKLETNARKAGLLSRIQLHQSDSDRLGVPEKVDFALVFWMVHEVPEPGKLFEQIRDVLKPGGHLLLAEPKIHVTGSLFDKIVNAAKEAGLEPDSELKVWFSRAMVFRNIQKS